jgi:hypothetical protein
MVLASLKNSGARVTILGTEVVFVTARGIC